MIESEKPLPVRRIKGGVGRIVTRAGRGAPVLIFGLAEWQELGIRNTAINGRCRIEFDLDNAFSCQGYVNGMGAEHVVAPTAKIDLELRNDISFMILEPQTRPRRATLKKTDLVSSFGKARSAARISAIDGGLKLHLEASGVGFEWTKLVLYRTFFEIKNVAGLTSWAYVFPEDLCELKSAGGTDCEWSSPKPAFEPSVWIFRGSLSLRDMLKLWEPFGVQSRQSMMVRYPGGNYVLGDGNLSTYKMRLVLHPTRRREVFDETDVIMT